MKCYGEHFVIHVHSTLLLMNRGNLEKKHMFRNVSCIVKTFINENIFLLKNTFFTEKNINENVKNIYLISEIYFYTENVCVTNKI